mmetsp:Transcript_22594/g.19610  ORF Transcript_22594/g.19610 Transcript_22594/m.19610 type:complete len:271 (-) Transcript_22594:368-1180(-)|eukprot:CAMPEP_0114581556 /NCGR_PEP_ID=MMETSP0125-20121206/5651_1 /TAXON_ID=485358 ORGANISM="Aristerostoma sp., Strain ATCC 50986" /NCGR_SAMPLE_ID=MMETSP0125 /ASSEMBLY_ACC=CAM_ASM_000245 /LENGTH=270 /DNA_ID=CAMNT_0001773855 /DNA_START=637 /DNA_END=1449 /DNA_ORIENTATION=+
MSNCLAHYDTLGEEILEQTDGKVDVFVAGMGTGGTLTGVGNKLKAKLPDVKVVGVDPVGSVMADPSDSPKPFLVEGIGKPFVPDTCVRKVVDKFYKVGDKESFEMAKRLIKEEGLLCGGSCGTAVYAAIQYALENNLGEDKRIVVVLPDSVRNYLTKFISDEWMVAKGLQSNEIFLNKDSKLYGKKVSDLKLKNCRNYDFNLKVGDAFEIFNESSDSIPIVVGGVLKGALVEGQFLANVGSKGLNDEDSVQRAMTTDVPVVEMDTDLSIV